MPGPRCLLLILFLFPAVWGNAQYDEDRGFHLGINVTSVFSSLVGNDNSIAISNFPILIRFGKKNKLRLALGARVKRNDFFDVITRSNRVSEETRVFGKVGYEFPIFQDNRWGAYWGIDGLAKYEQDKITSFITGGTNVIKQDTYGLGAAGLIGIRFKISQRLYLTTEATIGFLASQVRNEQAGFGIPEEVINTKEFDFVADPPLFLYLNYAF